jgi:hypothetical protein
VEDIKHHKKESSNMNKRSLMVMVLIGLLGFGMIFGGCENGTTPNDGDKKEEVVERVVEEKYRGTWKSENNIHTIILYENKCKIQANSSKDAWTVGTDLFTATDPYAREGYFSDDNTLMYESYEEKYIKQQ